MPVVGALHPIGTLPEAVGTGVVLAALLVTSVLAGRVTVATVPAGDTLEVVGTLPLVVGAGVVATVLRVLVTAVFAGRDAVATVPVVDAVPRPQVKVFGTFPLVGGTTAAHFVTAILAVIIAQ